jgi:hypothetical protein
MPLMTPDEEQRLVEHIERGEENPDDWGELPASSEELPPKRLGAVVSVRLDSDLAPRCRKRLSVAVACPAQRSVTLRWRANSSPKDCAHPPSASPSDSNSARTAASAPCRSRHTIARLDVATATHAQPLDAVHASTRFCRRWVTSSERVRCPSDKWERASAVSARPRSRHDLAPLLEGVASSSQPSTGRRALRTTRRRPRRPTRDHGCASVHRGHQRRTDRAVLTRNAATVSRDRPGGATPNRLEYYEIINVRLVGLCHHIHIR